MLATNSICLLPGISRLAAVLTIFADPDAPRVTVEIMTWATDFAAFYPNAALRTSHRVAWTERLRADAPFASGSLCGPFLAARTAARRNTVTVTGRTRKAVRRVKCQKFLANRAVSTKEGWILGISPSP